MNAKFYSDFLKEICPLDDEEACYFLQTVFVNIIYYF